MNRMLVLSLLAIPVLPACADGATNVGATDAASSSVVAEFACAKDPRVLTYTANLVKPGLLGKATFTLTSADPAPPRRGLDAWTVRVTDSAGAAIPGATMTISGVMPDHQHGWSTKPEIVPVGDGTTFVFQELNLFMDGVWNVTIGVRTADQALDSATFTFCVG